MTFALLLPCMGISAADVLAGRVAAMDLAAGEIPGQLAVSRLARSIRLENQSNTLTNAEVELGQNLEAANPSMRISVSAMAAKGMKMTALCLDQAGRVWRFPLMHDRIVAGGWGVWESLPVGQNPGRWLEPGPALPLRVQKIEVEIPGKNSRQETYPYLPQNSICLQEAKVVLVGRSLETQAWEIFDLLDQGSAEWGVSGNLLSDFGAEGAPGIPLVVLTDDAGRYRVGMRIRGQFQGPVVAEISEEVAFSETEKDEQRFPRISLPPLKAGTWFVDVRLWNAEGTLINRKDFLVYQFRESPLEPEKASGSGAFLTLRGNCVRDPEDRGELVVQVGVSDASALGWKLEDFSGNEVSSGRVPVEAKRNSAVTLGAFPQKPGAYYLVLSLERQGSVLDSDRILIGRLPLLAEKVFRSPKPLQPAETGGAIFALLRPFDGMTSKEDLQRLDRGFRVARDMGNSFVDLQVPWRDLEPLPGVYQFDRLEKIVDLAAKHDLKVNISPWFYSMHAPRWLLHLPQRDNEGASSLGRRGFIIDRCSEEYQQALFRLWKALAGYFSDRPEVAGYLLQNPSLDWIWWEYLASRTYAGYGAATTKAYRSFLHRRYEGSLPAISRTYGETISAWDSLHPPQPVFQGEADERPAWRDYYDFRIEDTRKGLEELFQVVRSVDPERRLFQYQYHGGGPQEAYYPLFQKYHVEPTCGAVEEDHYQRFLTRYDLWGLASRGEPNPAQRTTPAALNTGFTAILEGGRLAARYSLEWHNSFPEPDDKLFREGSRTREIRTQVSQVLANKTPEQFARWSRAMIPFREAEPAPRPVGALVSHDQAWFVRRSFNSHAINGYEVSRYMTEIEHIVPQWVSDHTPVDLLSKCPALIVDTDNRWISANTVAALTDYVRRGGVLLLAPGAGDLRGAADLQQALGCQVVTVDAGSGGLVGLDGAKLAFAHQSSVKVPESARIRARFATGSPAVAEWALGKGRVILLGGTLHWLKSRGVLSVLGVPIPRWHDADSPSLRLVSAQSGTKRLVVATHFLSLPRLREAEKGKSLDDRVRVLELSAGNYDVTELLENRVVGQFSDSQLRDGIPVELSPGQSCVFQIQPTGNSAGSVTASSQPLPP